MHRLNEFLNARLRSENAVLAHAEESPPWWEEGVTVEIDRPTYYRYLELLPPRFMRGDSTLWVQEVYPVCESECQIKSDGLQLNFLQHVKTLLDVDGLRKLRLLLKPLVSKDGFLTNSLMSAGDVSRNQAATEQYPSSAADVSFSSSSISFCSSR